MMLGEDIDGSGTFLSAKLLQVLTKYFNSVCQHQNIINEAIKLSTKKLHQGSRPHEQISPNDTV
jgi:hypothetical protein